MSRYTFYFIVTALGAVYYFIPGFLFTALSMFTWVCWIAPDNIVSIRVRVGLDGSRLSITTETDGER